MIIISQPDTYRSEREYVTEVIFGQYLGLEYKTRVIESFGEVHIGASGDKQLIRVPDDLFSVKLSKWLTSCSLPIRPLKVWEVLHDLPEADVFETSIPVIYGREPGRPGFFRAGKEEIQLGLDVLGSTFFMLTRYEEMVKPQRDEHDRFPTVASLSYQETFADRPIINEYLEILWVCLRRLWPRLKRKERNYRCYLSHDVDDIVTVVGKPFTRVIRRIGGDIIFRADPKLAIRSMIAALGRNFEVDPCNTFEWIMDVSARHGINSTFNFMGDLGHTQYDKRYRLGDRWVRFCLRRIIQEGHTIGFHPTYGSFLNREKTKDEFARLRAVAEKEGAKQDEWGGRQHYLRWQNPSTWQHWEDAGLDYDSTVGFCDLLGFRTGCCFDYPVFNLKARKKLKLRERPLMVIDDVVLKRSGRIDKEVFGKIAAVNRKCRRFGGEFNLLWHNLNVISRMQKESYLAVIEKLA